METEKNKKIGLGIIVIGTIFFFMSFVYFDQPGTKIEYQNPIYMIKMFCSYGILFLTLYFSLYFISGKKLANQIGGTMFLLFVASLLIGFMLHG